MEHDAQPLLHTVAEAAAALKLSRSVTYLLVASGQLKSVKIGRARRITNADLQAFVDHVRTADEPVRIGSRRR